jgi:hypothetical protein
VAPARAGTGRWRSLWANAGTSYNVTELSEETGLVFPDGIGAGLGFTAVLPTDLTPGSQLRIEFFWHINQTGCSVDLRQSFSSATRLGEVAISSPTVEIPYIVRGTIEPNEVLRFATRTTRDGGYRPGDIIKYGLYRASFSDTCTNTVYIDGARILYD